MSTVTTIPAQQYERETCVSGMYNIKIKEVFIPSLNLIFNNNGDVFSSDRPLNKWVKIDLKEVEYPLTDIQLSKKLVDKISEIARLKLELKEKEQAAEEDLAIIWE